jgi:hypothetical protein
VFKLLAVRDRPDLDRDAVDLSSVADGARIGCSSQVRSNALAHAAATTRPSASV